MYTTLDWLQGEDSAPKSNYTTLDWIEEDKPEPPESQKRAEALGRQHADEIFAGKFKTRTGVPIVDETILGNDGTERQAIPRKVWWGNAPPTPGDPAAGKPQPGTRNVDAFINKYVNLGDLRDQNPQFDEPAYRREMAKRYNELYGAKIAGDIAEQDKTLAGRIINRAEDYIPGSGTLMPNRAQRVRAAGAGLATGEASGRDIADAVLLAKEEEAAKNRGVLGMAGETVLRAPSFIAEVTAAGGLGRATALFGGLRAGQNYASGESALDAAKGLGREAVMNAAFGAAGGIPGLNRSHSLVASVPKLVGASQVGQEASSALGLNPEGAPAGSSLRRALGGDTHAAGELAAEVLAFGALEGAPRAYRSVFGRTKPPEIAQEPVQTPTPAVEPVGAPKPAEAKIEPPAPRWVKYNDNSYGVSVDLPGKGKGSSTLNYDADGSPHLYVDIFSKENGAPAGTGKEIIRKMVESAGEYGPKTVSGHFTTPEALGALGSEFGRENVKFRNRFDGQPVNITFQEAAKNPSAYIASVDIKPTAAGYGDTLYEIGKRIRNREPVSPEEMAALKPEDRAKFESVLAERAAVDAAKKQLGGQSDLKVTQKSPNGIEVVDGDFSKVQSDDYVYHVTTADRAAAILKNGFLPDQTPSMDSGFYRDYSKGKVFYSDRGGVGFWKERIEQHLQAQTDGEPPNMVVLRVPKKNIANLQKDALGEKDSLAGSYFSGPPETPKTTLTSDLPPAEPPRPAQTATEPGQGTSIKNAVTEIDRRAFDLPDLPPAEKRTWIEAADLARKNKLVETADALAASIIEKPRPISDVEVAALTIRATELKNARNAIGEQFDKATPGSPEAKALADQLDLIRNQYDTLTQATKNNAGSENARGLAARKMMMGEDFSILEVERDLRARAERSGKVLTPEALKTAVEKAKKLAEGEAAIEAMKNPTPESIIEQAAAESNNVPKKPLGQSKAPKVSWTEERIKGLEAKAVESSKKLKDILSRLNSGVDPEIVVHLSNIALAKIARGSYNAAKFTADIVKEFGEKARKYAGQAWEAAVQQASEKVEKATAKAKDKIAAGELDPGLTKLLRDVLRGITQRRISAGENVKGTEAREAIVGEVHSLFPEIDRPTLEDAISGIGKFRPLSKDEVSVAVRDIQGQLQQLGKLRYLAKGEMPPRTGTEKRNPSVEELDLQKQYKDQLRESGIEATSPDQLRSTKDAIKARYQHDIESMDRQIAEGEKLDRTRAKPLNDPEIDALKAKRDQKKAEYDAIFGDPAISDEAQAKKLIESLDKQAATIKAQIESGNIYPDSTAAEAARAKRADLASTQPGVADAIERLNNLKQWRDNLRNSDVPRLIEERLAALEKQKANLERRIATNDIGPNPKADKLTNAKIEEIEYRNHLLKQDIRDMRRDLQPKTMAGLIATPFNIARGLMLTGEMSFVLRQGMLTAASHPIMVAKAIPDAVVALVSSRATFRSLRAMENDAMAPQFTRDKLHINREGAPLSAKEEAYVAYWTEKIPVLRNFERSANVFLNKIRIESYKAIAKSVAKDGKVTPDQGRAIAHAVNVFTGRGTLGSAEGAAVALNSIFLAPRYTASRFQYALGQPMWKAPAEARKAIAKEYVRQAVGMMAVAALGTAMGADLELDPRSSDFLKLKVGNTRIDLGAGLNQIATFAARMFTGQSKSAIHGGITDLRGPNKPKTGQNVLDVMTRFGRSKLGPAGSFAVDTLTGEDIMGEPTDALKTAKRMILPITYGDIYEAVDTEGAAPGLAMGIAAFLGAGLQTIKPSEEKVAQKLNTLTSPTPKRKQGEAPDAYQTRVAAHEETVRRANVTALSGQVQFDKAKEMLIDQWKKTGRSTALYRDGKPTELKNRIDRLKTLLP